MSFIFYDFLRSQMLPLSEIDAKVPQKGKIIDLGCGEGVIAKYLARVSTRQIVGVDNNKKRLQKSGSQNLQFTQADIRNYPVTGADAVIISDVLHHIAYKGQQMLLTKISRSLKKGGTLIIKEIDESELVRSRSSRLWDFVFYPKDKIYYHRSQDLKKYLEELDFKVKISRPSRLFPGSTTLFVCQKS